MRTLISLCLVAVPAFAQDTSIFPDKTTRDARQVSPDLITEETRAFLKAKMKGHNKDMRDLSIAVATVKMSEVQRLAQGVANMPRLDPAGGPAAKLPARFFELQDLLRKTAQDLADAGKANDMTVSLAKYQELIGHCVVCHATFKAQVQKPQDNKKK
jgi:hypothetical protein